MDDALDVNCNESFDYLLEDGENFLNGQSFIFIFKIAQKITFLTKLHHYLQFFLVVVIGLVNGDKIGVFEFCHYLYLFEGFINFEGIEVDFFEGVLLAFVVGDEVDGAEASLPQDFDRFVVFH